MSVFGASARLIASMAAVLLGVVSALVIWTCAKQLQRDGDCRDRIRAAAAQVEAVRTRLGYQPSARELETTEARHVSFYTRFADDPRKLRPLGARAADDYMFALWRGEWHVYYHSWSGADTCDSEAWIPLTAIGLPMALVSLSSFWLLRRRRRGLR